MSDALDLDGIALEAEQYLLLSDPKGRLAGFILALVQRVREAEAGPAWASASEVTELRAEVAQLRRSRAEAWSQRDLARLTAEQDVEAAEARVAALSDALRKYGNHTINCASVPWNWQPKEHHVNVGQRPACTCGFDALLQEAPK